MRKILAAGIRNFVKKAVKVEQINCWEKTDCETEPEVEQEPEVPEQIKSAVER